MAFVVSHSWWQERTVLHCVSDGPVVDMEFTSVNTDTLALGAMGTPSEFDRRKKKKWVLLSVFCYFFVVFRFRFSNLFVSQSSFIGHGQKTVNCSVRFCSWFSLFCLCVLIVPYMWSCPKKLFFFCCCVFIISSNHLKCHICHLA